MENSRSDTLPPWRAKPPEKIIRTDNWQLQPTQKQRLWMNATVDIYRAYVQPLLGVVYAHWPAIAKEGDAQLRAVEKLVHATADNPRPRYALFDKRFPKFPSYLRRAAINFCIGQISSFVSNYARWQSDIRSKRDAQPPRRGNATEANPVLYRGHM